MQLSIVEQAAENVLRGDRARTLHTQLCPDAVIWTALVHESGQHLIVGACAPLPTLISVLL